MDKKYIITALVYAFAGLLLGAHMAATKNHGQLVTHAHIMLLGFVTTFIYGLCYKLWISPGNTKVAVLQLLLHQTGVITMLTGLFLIYGKFINEDTIEPVMAISSIAVIVGMGCMIFQFLNKNYQRS